MILGWSRNKRYNKYSTSAIKFFLCHLKFVGRNVFLCCIWMSVFPSFFLSFFAGSSVLLSINYIVTWMGWGWGKKGKWPVQIWGKGKRKEIKRKNNIYIGGRRGKHSISFFGTQLSWNYGGLFCFEHKDKYWRDMLKGEKLEIRMARKDFVALFILYIYVSLGI